MSHAAATIFGLSLIAAGLSSTVVGTLAGQVVMQGFIRFHIPLWVRRTVTMLPSFIVILMGLDPTRILVMSQVLLSFGIALALVPLLIFTSDSKLMGDLVNSQRVKQTRLGDCGAGSGAEYLVDWWERHWDCSSAGVASGTIGGCGAKRLIRPTR